MWSLKNSLCYGDRPEDCPVVENRVIAPGFCRLTLQAPAIAQKACPGQFVMLYLPPGRQQQLPRPLSIFRVDRERQEISFFFQVKGEGTGILAGVEPGSLLKLLGPLGTGFSSVMANSILVAGGMGIAPLVYLATEAAKPCSLIYAARRADQLVCPPADLTIAGLTLLEVTEDGSKGKMGSATDLLSRLLNSEDHSCKAIFACGPRPMLQTVANLGLQKGLPTWVSLEERMACGIGACVGCAVATTDGYKRVCHDGPVFPAEVVIFSDQT
ncbi:MAG: dihydroorotate dehydrogenase electron transfer subunit [Dethiobacteria bacterium]|nr:dihydroorotate dehydrogenase electron transfer subunit [Dethiobacteria bacterium]